MPSTGELSQEYTMCAHDEHRKHPKSSTSPNPWRPSTELLILHSPLGANSPRNKLIYQIPPICDQLLSAVNLPDRRGDVFHGFGWFLGYWAQWQCWAVCDALRSLTGIRQAGAGRVSFGGGFGPLVEPRGVKKEPDHCHMRQPVGDS